MNDARVHGRDHGLDDEDVAGADVLVDADEDVLVAELEHLAFAEWRLQVVTDGLGELRVRVAAEDPKLLVHGALRRHASPLPGTNPAPYPETGHGPGED